jgi:hypothetical protein
MGWLSFKQDHSFLQRMRAIPPTIASHEDEKDRKLIIGSNNHCGVTSNTMNPELAWLFIVLTACAHERIPTSLP